MARKNLRSDSLLFSLADIHFHEQEKLNVNNKLVQLPSYRFIIERFFTISKELATGKISAGSIKDSVHQLSSELEVIWIYCNVYPLSRTSSKKRITTLVNRIKGLRKVNVSRHSSNSFQEKLDLLRKDLQNGFDICCRDSDRIRMLAEMYKVKMLKPEEDLWSDNCVPNDMGICDRKMYCAGNDKEWCKAAMKRYNRSLKQGTFSDNDYDTASRLSSESEDDDIQSGKEVDYEPPANIFGMDSPRIATRTTAVVEENLDNTFKLQCRSGFRTMNTDIMVVLGLMVSKYGVSENKASECLQLVANTLFGQSLKLPSQEVIEEEDRVEIGGDSMEGDQRETEEVDRAEIEEGIREEGIREAGGSEIEESDEPKTKRRKKRGRFGDLTSTLPGPRTIHKWIEDEAVLSLWHAADEIKNASSRDAVVTLGWDDTVKKAGHHRHDLKGGHVTIIEPDKRRSTYSTGLYENISHSGKDSAETVEMVMEKMSVLTGISRDDFFSTIDFWINDRAGDNIIMLDELGVEEEKRLFCNAHVLLTVDEGIDSVFKDTETMTGKSKLISKDAGHVFTSPQNSIFYLGLIALAKLLSDSHCTESISLYKDYKKFLDEQRHEGNEKASKVDEFTGFRSNRFGRIPYLSNVVLQHEDLLKLFFEKNVDENANKLVLASFSFINSPWFLLCCRVCAKFKHILVDDIMLALGIDHSKTKKSPYRSWAGIKELFLKKLHMLTEMMNAEPEGNPTGFDLLIKKCSSSIHDNIKRQLNYMSFFAEDLDVPINESKLLQAPMTNDGCESELATCGEAIKKVGSTVSLGTLSDRHVIVRNKLFESGKWKSLSISEKRRYVKWSRNSEEAKLVKAKGKEYLQKVKAAVNLQLDVKADKKKKKIKRSLDILEILKKTGGPVTADDVGRLESMSTCDLLYQISYLRCTITPHIKQKRKIGNKFQLFSDDELRSQIIDVLKPNEDVEEDIEGLVAQVLSKESETIPAPIINDDMVGKIGIWKGSFDRQCVGVLVTSGKLQLFRTVKRGYYKLNDLVESSCDWTIKEFIPESDYNYVDCQGHILLKLNQ